MFRFSIGDLIWLTAFAAVSLVGARLTSDGAAKDAVLPAACVFVLVSAIYGIIRYARPNG